MFTVEQVAMRTNDMRRDLEKYMKHGHEDWVLDEVYAQHIFTNGFMGYTDLGEGFRVALAFNYSLIPNVEFELIQLLEGNTVQISHFEQGSRMSHLGYHVKDQFPTGPDTLNMELKRLKDLGGTVVQISQTTMHQNTSKRYRYAFVLGLSGRLENTMPVKVIQRIDPPSSPQKLQASLQQGRELFSWLSQP